VRAEGGRFRGGVDVGELGLQKDEGQRSIVGTAEAVLDADDVAVDGLVEGFEVARGLE
jgi:hypothetical protein